jgi:hypothetical protein
MAASHSRIESVDVLGSEVVLRFWADNEKRYVVESTPSLSGAGWTEAATATPTALPKLIEVRTPFLGTRFYRIAAVPAP